MAWLTGWCQTLVRKRLESIRLIRNAKIILCATLTSIQMNWFDKHNIADRVDTVAGEIIRTWPSGACRVTTAISQPAPKVSGTGAPAKRHKLHYEYTIRHARTSCTCLIMLVRMKNRWLDFRVIPTPNVTWLPPCPIAITSIGGHEGIHFIFLNAECTNGSWEWLFIQQVQGNVGKVRALKLKFIIIILTFEDSMSTLLTKQQ